MKMKLTTTIALDQGTVTVISEDNAYSDEWEDVRDQWLVRHAEAIASITTIHFSEK